MRRREFIVAGLAGTVALPSRTLAQSAPRKIGFVSWFTPQVASHADQFRKGLRDLGYAEGRDITVEAHFTSGDRERTREIVRKYVRDIQARTIIRWATAIFTLTFLGIAIAVALFGQYEPPRFVVAFGLFVCALVTWVLGRTILYLVKSLDGM